jgi:hypothetical protein
MLGDQYGRWLGSMNRREFLRLSRRGRGPAEAAAIPPPAGRNQFARPERSAEP